MRSTTFGYLVRFRGTLALLGCTGLAGCTGEARRPAAGADSAAPPSAAAPAVALDSVSPDSLLRLGRAASFDTAGGSADEQLLTGGRCPVDCPAPRLRIEPQSASASATREALGAGRLVARIVNRDSVEVPALNLAPRDTAYWWVDSVGGRWRSTFVSSRQDRQSVVRPLTLEVHPERRWHQSISRWTLEAGGEMPWVTCMPTGCCKGPPAL